MSDNNPPAFPVPEASAHLGNVGMALRDWFAGQAMIGYLAAHDGQQRFPKDDELAKDCYDAADAMLKERASREAP